MLHLIPSEKKFKDIGLKYTSYVIPNFKVVSVAFDGYPETLSTNVITHKPCLGKRIYPRIVFEPGMLFQEKRIHF